jgi:hypothetical protein
MPKNTFTEKLSECLKSDIHEESGSRMIKKSIMRNISDSASIRKNMTIVKALKQAYKRPTKNQSLRIRNEVIEYIREDNKKRSSYDLLHYGLAFVRKTAAVSFSFALLAVTVLAPLQYSNYQAVIPQASAAFLECTGDVYLNGEKCQVNTIIEIEAGDAIETQERSRATIFYTDYSVVRLEEDTQAELDDETEDQINFEKGEMWVHSPTETKSKSLKITTPVLKAKIPQGSAGIYTKKNTTELISDTAIIQVQIDGPSGKTDILTVAPDQGVVKVRKGRVTSNVVTHQLSDKQEQWVTEHRAKDVLHLAEVKKQTVEDHQELAGGLPGGVSDYVGKMTQNARTSLVWDESVKTELKLTQLDELFSETLVLLEKGDKTTALDNFEVYRKKLSSLFTGEFDKLSVTESAKVQEKAVALLEAHVRTVSPYSVEDKQYVLKEEINQLTLNLDILNSNALAENVQETITQSQLVDAYKTASDGNMELAETLLKEASDSLTKESVSDTTLPLLSDISGKSDELDQLVNEMKKQTVEHMKLQEPTVVSKDIESGIITGTAYSPDSDDESEDQDIVSSVIVGQAIKQEDSSL